MFNEDTTKWNTVEAIIIMVCMLRGRGKISQRRCGSL